LHGNPAKAKEIGKRGGEQNRHYSTEDDAPELPPLKTGEDVRLMLAQVAVDLRHRKIDPRMAVGLSQLAGTLLKAIEVADLEGRLSQLEEKIN
jgi:hypothetical protein